MNKEIAAKYGNDPIALCKDWLAEAEKTEINDPEAVCLATVDAKGRPSNRMVLLKDISDQGFKFHTNANSRKGRDMAQNPYVSLCLYWKSTRKQIRVEGTIRAVDDEEVDTYFAARAPESQIGAWASQQSERFKKEENLQSAFEKYLEKFTGRPGIPRPPHWKGYRVMPTSIEFWIANRFRLHTRFLYTKNKDGSWDSTWLYP